MEIYKAIEKGYRLLNTYEVWHWEKQTTGLFRDYIKTFLKVKLETSDLPPNVVTNEDKVLFLSEIDDKLGIKIVLSDLKPNPGRRAVAKLCLNSLWGKFGQRQNMTQSKLIRTEEDLYKLVFSPRYTNIVPVRINDELYEFSYKFKNNHISDPFNTNVTIASFTTAYARLRLYDMMDRLGVRVKYHDTDSIIYLCSDTLSPVEMGYLLSEWTDELWDKKLKKSAKIILFVSGGPKAYAYVLDNGKVVMKLKGFNLNYKNKKSLNILNMFSIIACGMKMDNATSELIYDHINDHLNLTGEETTISYETRKTGRVTVSENNIVRDKKRKIIRTVNNMTKVFSHTYDKRVILPFQNNEITTLPYGFVGSSSLVAS
jgi:hypothetical protein